MHIKGHILGLSYYLYLREDGDETNLFTSTAKIVRWQSIYVRVDQQIRMYKTRKNTISSNKGIVVNGYLRNATGINM
jgi:hypothetical protein